MKEIMKPLMGVKEIRQSLIGVDKNQHVSSGQKQNDITINVIIVAKTFDTLHHQINKRLILSQLFYQHLYNILVSLNIFARPISKKYANSSCKVYI